MAMRACQLMAWKPFGVDGFAADGEARGQETLRLIRAQAMIAQQIGMLGDPQQLLGSELLPAVRAGRPGQ